MDRDLDLLVVGEINPDIVVRDPDPRPAFGQVERWVEGVELVIGSSAVIMACGAARLGLRVAMLGVVGDDALGRFMLAEMAAHGLDLGAVRTDPQTPTGASVILSGGDDRAILTAPGTIPRLRVDGVPDDLLRRARHVHIGSVFLLDDARADLPTLLRRAHALGSTTSVDPNWDPRETWDGGVAAILAETDVFLPNLAEATRIAAAAGLTASGDGPEATAQALLGLGPRVVAMKLGADGGLAVDANGRSVHAGPLPVTPIDTTGAGDSFDAGFVMAWVQGRSLEAATALAVACGALSTSAVGGTAGQPDLAAAERAAGGALVRDP